MVAPKNVGMYRDYKRVVGILVRHCVRIILMITHWVNTCFGLTGYNPTTNSGARLCKAVLSVDVLCCSC